MAYSFDTIRVGDVRSLSHNITASDIKGFKDLTGDTNPLHLDVSFARRTYFRKPVVYGMLPASFISTMIGTIMPGPGTLWLSQTLEFLQQVYEGDTIRIEVTVKQKSQATRVLVLDTVIYNQNNQRVIEGEAKVRMIDVALAEESEINKKRSMVILITGASGGIGSAVARKLAVEGHAVIVNFKNSEDRAVALVEEIKAAGGTAIAMRADISNMQEVSAMCQQATQMLGPIQGLVLNAAKPIVLSVFQNTTWEAVQEHIDVQVKGAFHCAQSLLSGMVECGGGSLVMIGSVVADNMPPSQQTGYVIAKAALAAFMRSLAVEYGPKKIRVNMVSPGMTKTDMIAELPDRVKELTRMLAPLRQLGEPEDVAGAVDFLMSPAARHITGETIRVCGGSIMA